MNLSVYTYFLKYYWRIKTRRMYGFTRLNDLNQWLDFEALTWLGLFKTIWSVFVYKPTECTLRLRDLSQGF